MPKRVTRRRHGGRDHNFPGRGAARSGAERSAAVGARPCKRGAGGLHGATGSTELPSLLALSTSLRASVTPLAKRGEEPPQNPLSSAMESFVKNRGLSLLL